MSSTLLFDEIEKAHSLVLNLFLQIREGARNHVRDPPDVGHSGHVDCATTRRTVWHEGEPMDVTVRVLRGVAWTPKLMSLRYPP